MHEAEKERLERIREETAYHYDELINNERYFAQIREDIISGNIKIYKPNYKTLLIILRK